MQAKPRPRPSRATKKAPEQRDELSASVRVYEAVVELLTEHGADDPGPEAHNLLIRLSEAARFGNFASAAAVQAMLRLPLEVEAHLRGE